LEGVIRGYAGDGTLGNKAFSLQDDLPALALKLAELGEVAAVVIDPISAYLGDTDSHKNAEVRGLLAPLSDLAARYCVSIIGVSHLSKAVGSPALMRVSGSLAFVAAARAAYLVTPAPNDKTRRLLLPMKNNLGPDTPGLAFTIEGATVMCAAGPIETSRVVWDAEPVHFTADEAIQSEATEAKCTSAVEEVADWLQEVLIDGPRPADEVIKLAKAEGFAERTLRRARKRLGIKAMKREGGWFLSLPPKAATLVEDGQGETLAAFREVGRLQEL
jgi:hypothetical protein